MTEKYVMDKYVFLSREILGKMLLNDTFSVFIIQSKRREHCSIDVELKNTLNRKSNTHNIMQREHLRVLF